MTLAHILTDEQARILVEERRALAELRLTLERVAMDDDDAASFDASLRQLDELFLLVVAGEFNAGKSAFINALMGEPLLEEGVTPTTQRVTLVKHGEKKSRETQSDAFEIVEAPIEILETLNIVDTPGTNAVKREHEAITREFLPRADMVLFVTSADRPFTESERAFLEGIRNWGKKVAVVINKIDLLMSSEDIQKVIAFVRDNASKLLGTEVDVFPVSARQAARGKSEGDDALVQESRFEALESFVVRTLDDGERVRLKLLNPLGVGSALTEKYAAVVAAELDLLKEDLRMLDDIESHLEVYERDQHRDFAYRLSHIDNALLDFESRGANFFEETLRLSRIFDLINKAKMKSDFEKKVVVDLPQAVEKRVEAVIDWMVESELGQWKAVTAHLEERRSAHEKRMIGKLPASFVQDRGRLLETVGAAARSAIDGYDRDSESSRLAESVRTAVASTALLEVGAVGLGGLVAAIATTTAADVTGILARAQRSWDSSSCQRSVAKPKPSFNLKVGEVEKSSSSSANSSRDEGEHPAHPRRVAPYTRFVRQPPGDRPVCAEAS